MAQVQTAKPQCMEIISQIERKKKLDSTSSQISAMNFCKEGGRVGGVESYK